MLNQGKRNCYGIGVVLFITWRIFLFDMQIARTDLSEVEARSDGFLLVRFSIANWSRFRL